MVRVSGSLKDRLAFFESQEKLNGADSEQTKKNDVPTKVMAKPDLVASCSPDAIEPRTTKQELLSDVDSEDRETAQEHGHSLSTPTKHRASLPKRKRQATGNIVRTLKTREEEGIITHRCSNVSATQSIPSAIDANKCSAAEKTPCSVAKTLYRPFSLDSGINSEERPTLVKKRVGNSVGAIGAELSKRFSLNEFDSSNKDDDSMSSARSSLLKLKRRSTCNQREPMLLLLKGKQRIRCVRVTPHISSLNHHDSFVYDDGQKSLFVFIGKHASRLKSAKASEIAIRIKDSEYHGLASIATIKDEDDTVPNSEARKFWETMGGLCNDISYEPCESDADFEDALAKVTNVYGLSDNEWQVVVNGRRISCSVLDRHHAFVVQHGDEIFVWNGQYSDEEERQNAETFANSLLTDVLQSVCGPGPEWRKVEMVVDKGERVVFKEKFADFQEGMDISVKPQGNVQRKDKTPYVTGADVVGKSTIEVETMYQSMAPLDEPLDDGLGEVTVWHCTEREQTQLEEIEMGHFYSNDSYVVLYSRSDKKDSYLMYYWMGANARANDNGAAAVLALQLNNKLGAPQIRVQEGKEPRHFLSIFTQRRGFIVHKGSRQSGSTIQQGMYKIHGREHVKRVQYQPNEDARSLCSAYTFIIVHGPRKGSIWNGSNSPSYLQEHAKMVADKLLQLSDLKTINEGQETSRFWSDIGGKQEYSQLPIAPMSMWPHFLVRAWTIDHASGEPRAHEIISPTQMDLRSTDCVIVDAYNALYVWVGPIARQIDMKAAVLTGKNYEDFVLSKDPSRGKANKFHSLLVNAGSEPIEFKALFPGWSDTHAVAVASEVNSSLTGLRRLVTNGSLSDSCETLTTVTKYPLAELLVPVEQLPAGVDPAKKEAYLLDTDFEIVFKMTRSEYLAFPMWKQVQLKKSTPLF